MAQTQQRVELNAAVDVAPLAASSSPLFAEVETELDRAATATPSERRELADRLNAKLAELPGNGGRAQADALVRLLEGGRLGELVDSEGKTCRAAAAEALMALGYPYALELSPEDLDHVRQGGGFKTPVASVATALVLVGALGWLEVAIAGSGISTGLVAAHAGLTILSAVAVAVTRPLTRARKYSVWALVISGLEGLGLGILGAPGALISGLGALVAAALMSKKQ